MNRLWQDLRYATRNLLGRPAFALASILSLALGVGACAAIFSIVDAVLVHPLPYPDSVRVVQLKEISAKGTRMPFGEPNFVDEVRLDKRHPRSDRKSTRLNSSHVRISYAVFCLKKK